MPDIEIRAEDARYPEDVADDIQEAAEQAVRVTDGGGIRYLTAGGDRVAALVPLDLVQYALRHGWGR